MFACGSDPLFSDILNQLFSAKKAGYTRESMLGNHETEYRTPTLFFTHVVRHDDPLTTTTTRTKKNLPRKKNKKKT